MIKKWNTDTYVIQIVGENGIWYDHATCSVNPFSDKLPADLKKWNKLLFPDSGKWRLIHRVSEEEIIGESK